MNVQTLNEKLINNAELIKKILTKLNLNNIREVEHQHLIKFPRPGGDNQSGIVCYTNSLRVIGFTDNSYTGNIYTLVMKITNCSFYEALQKITKWIGLNSKDIVKIRRPFKGFYMNILTDSDNPETKLKTYSELCLPSADNLSKMFLDDGIALDVQKALGMRYSIEDDAVLIPIYSIDHKMVGVKARNNDANCDFDHRWFAWLPYPKTCVVYGLDINYVDIIKKKTLIIFEAEKSVAQAMTMGLNCTCAIAGHNLSKAQVRIINSLMVDNIIVAFDEGISEDKIKFEAKKLLVNNQIYTNTVSYLYDREHKYLPEGSKNSPSDLGRDILNKIIKECRVYVENN